MRKIVLVGGARPNFMKLAPLYEELRLFPSDFTTKIIHTGQHYDYEMSGVFFKDLVLPEPNLFLGVGSGCQGEQTGKIMIEFEKAVMKEKPDLIIVVGDVNSTLACAVVASKLLIPLAHVEAGLRSFDRTMPEEINRIVADVLSDYLFTTEQAANENLKKEGIKETKVFFVGDVMIDSLLKSSKIADKSNILTDLNLSPQDYGLVTLHRAGNVDTREALKEIMSALDEIAGKIKLIFPMHPRTRKNIEKFGIKAKQKNIVFTDPLGYIDFLKLEKNAKLVLTDSGGIQIETTVFNIPCLTIRNNTERPATIELGTNQLIGTKKENIINSAFSLLDGKYKIRKKLPDVWDGKAAKRIINILRK